MRHQPLIPEHNLNLETKFAHVAQLVERMISNHPVASSNLAVRSRTDVVSVLVITMVVVAGFLFTLVSKYG